MSNYLRRLYPELKEHYRELKDKYPILNRLENPIAPLLLIGVAGAIFRTSINLSMPKAGLSKAIMAYDELVRPSIVFLTMLGANKISKSRFIKKYINLPEYIPALSAFLLWSVIWESSEYLTPIPQMIRAISPTPWGTAKDVGLDLFTIRYSQLYHYRKKLNESE